MHFSHAELLFLEDFTWDEERSSRPLKNGRLKKTPHNSCSKKKQIKPLCFRERKGKIELPSLFIGKNFRRRAEITSNDCRSVSFSSRIINNVRIAVFIELDHSVDNSRKKLNHYPGSGPRTWGISSKFK